MTLCRRMLFAMAALAGVAGCSGPEIVNRSCPGLVSGAMGQMVLSAQNAGPPLDPRGLVAERTARLVAAQAARVPEAVMVQPAGLRLEALAAPAQRVVRIDLLAMTTGGQYGAFSSGFLKGWGESNRRPDFTVVTGASAGGVVAPVIFAGKAFDDRLALNAGIGEGDVVRKRSFLELLGASSLFSTAPLQRAVAAAVDAALINAIAARWRAGNDLFLGATNLDQGRFELLDIGMFAAMDGVPLAVKRDCVVGAIMATSAIPGLFPPKRIGGDLYTDAGVRQSVFLRGVRDGIRESERALGVDVRVTATLLVNSDLMVRPERTETGLLSVAERTFTLVNDEGLRESIVETVDLAQQSGWTLRAAVAPDFDTLGCGDDTALFSPCVTRKLFEAGRAMGRAPRIAWLSGRELRLLARRF